MYEELIKRLREAPSDWPDAELHYEAADAIEELQKPKWIPVTERLPEEYEYVLCKTDYGMEVGYHRNEWGQDEWTTGKFASGSFDISHWIPLPQPPESDGE